ncbi:hypothetical protein AB0G74_03140 [Streptomyces sp. NPDC020875]|uniref:hypothetical protein n=1 Tax=Streptomyces sp. NPDC020875 TaxID=3154898 RepID=UPI0033C9043F
MSPRSMTRLCLGLLVLALILGIGTALAWPGWIWFLLPTLVAGVFLSTMSLPDTPRSSDDGEAGPASFEELSEPPYAHSFLTDVPLPSAMPGYPFLFSATVSWRTTPDHSPTAHNNPAGLAVSSVLQRAQDAIAAEHPRRGQFLGHWLDGVLGTPVTDGSGLVTSFASGVRVTLRAPDQQRLDEIDDSHKSRDVWESRRQHELDRRSYLGDDVLRTPGSALVWWLARHEDDIERAVEMIAPLSCLSAAANDRELPEAFHHLFLPPEPPIDPGTEEPPHGHGPGPDGGFGPSSPAGGSGPGGGTGPSAYVSALIDEMGFAEDSADRQAFIDRLARMAEASGSPGTAAALRRDLLADRFSPPPPAPSPDGPAEAGPPHSPTAHSNGYAPNGTARPADHWGGNDLPPLWTPSPGAEPDAPDDERPE